MSTSQIRNLDYTILLCANMAVMRRFYKEVMAFPIEMDSENWVSFRVGASLLTLRPRAAEHGPLPAGSASVQLAFRVPPAAVDACYEELVAKGVSVIREPHQLPVWRHRAFFFHDPENNVIEIYAEI
jgi:glyoxylase I family protein